MLSLPEIYPKPVAFYQHPCFEGQKCEAMAPDADISRLHFFDADEHFTARIVSQFKLTKFRHMGRLHGEYLLLHKNLVALDRHGTPIKINTDALDDWAMSSLFGEIEMFCAEPIFPIYRRSLIEKWEEAPIAHNPVVLGGTHADHNYYHFSICTLPLVRHFPDSGSTCIGLPATCLERPFQQQLIQMTFGHRMVLPMADGVRVSDPTLIYEPVRSSGIEWLRKRTGLRAHRGNRLIYITRRSSQTGRVGGCIEETEDFTAFLRRHHFEIVDFGEGHVPVIDQVAMLDGARVVLSAHGANLTNLAYMAEDVSVVEVMPYYWTYFSHMQVACAAGLQHFGVVCHHVNENQNMVAKVETLEQALQAALEATPAYHEAGKFFPKMMELT